MNQRKNISDIFLLIIKWKRTFFIIFLLSAILSLSISLIIPKWYKATGKILISSTRQDIFDFGSLLGNIPLDIGSPPSHEMMRISAILNSRTFLDAIIKKFNLQEIYGEKYLFKTRDRLKEYIEIQPDFDESSISISFIYKSEPKKSATICKYMIEKLNLINSELQSAEAKNNRIFIQKMYEEAMNRLKMTEDSLRMFQKKYGTYQLDEQLKATIAAQAEMETSLLQNKIQYNFLNNIVDRNASQIKDLEIKIRVLESIINKFQSEKDESSIFTPLKDMPDQAIIYYKLRREIEIISKVLEFLTPQFEQAKIEEAQSKPNFIILDYPEVPEYKFKPKRAYIVLGATFSSLLFLLIFLWIRESVQELREIDPVKYNKYLLIYNGLKIWRKK